MQVEIAAASLKFISPVVTFRYESVSPQVAKFLRGHANRIRQYVGKSIIQIGKDLAGAKHYLSHGEFLKWVESEVGIPARTAQAYMQAAHWASDKRVAVALLPPSLLYVLSARSTPKEISDDVLRRAEAGERIELSSVRDEIKVMRASRFRHCDRSNRHASRDTTSCVEQVIGNVDTICKDRDAEYIMIKFVTILKRGLSASDFTQVHKLMTSDKILHSPDIVLHLTKAFQSIVLKKHSMIRHTDA